MIKLTINPTSSPETLLFHQSIITIGSGDVDLALPGESLQECHIKIIQEENRFVVLNLANDPFATLNSLPFGKKVISNHDILKIGNTEFEFEGDLSHVSEELAPLQPLFHPLDDVATNSDDDAAIFDIDALFREVDDLDDAEETEDPIKDIIPSSPLVEEQQSQIEHEDSQPAALASTPSAPSFSDPIEPKEISVHHRKASLKDSDDDSDIKNGGKESGEEEFVESWQSSWRIYLAFFVAAMVVASIFAAAIFVSVIDKSDEEEIAAAEAVSDVSMALAYAQVHHIKPQKQNWFDPDFLKNNLASVLSSEYPAFAHIDNQGQLTNCPYILRIYTSSDLSQFLVIAQPEPSLLQWLIPKASIIVDSRAMEMRNINDLKALNRLLVNPNTLDGANAVEISNLVQQGELIPIDSLAAQKGALGFTPPKALALIRPGAENLIYNAPRYYHFGESIINRAVQILQMVGNSHEVLRLQQEIGEISKFPNIVLYSSQGIQKAIQAQKALAAFAPLSNFFTAYLSFNDEGLITGSHLVLNGDHTNYLNGSSMRTQTNDKEDSSQQTDLDYADSSNITAMINPPTVSSPLAFDDQTDPAHPLLLQLTALAKERQQSLTESTEPLITLLNRNNETGINDFSEIFFKQLLLYEKIDQEFQDKITKTLADLYDEYSEMPLVQFSTYVKKAKLETLAQGSLTLRAKEIGNSLTPIQISNQMQKIHNAKDFQELEEHVKITADMLTLAHLPDPNQLIIYQNELRSRTLLKLGQFMLTPKTLLPSDQFQQRNHATLSQILKSAWVTDPEEYDFYINEFEILTDHFARENN